MRTLFKITALAVLACASGALAQQPAANTPSKVSWQIVTPAPAEQKAYLDSLITDKKHHGNLIHPKLLYSDVSETNQRSVCSGYASGTADTPEGSTTTDIDLSTSSVCRQLADVHNETVMVMPDPANHRAWMIFASCTSGYSGGQKATAAATMGYGALFMHKHPCLMQEGPNLSVVLGKEKHGYFIYVGTTSQLGGKAKVSKYNVVEVKQFVVKQNAAK